MTKPGERSLKDFSRLSLVIFSGAVFFTFATVGFINDIVSLGRMSRPGYTLAILLSGGFAILYALIGTFGHGWRRAFLALIFVVQFTSFQVASHFFPRAAMPHELDTAGIGRLQARIGLSGTFCVLSIALGYTLFIVLMSREGARFFRLKAEMDLATEIHKQLVPRIESVAAGFEFYGSSEPSGEVGGDLVDVVVTGTDADAHWVAYI